MTLQVIESASLEKDKKYSQRREYQSKAGILRPHVTNGLKNEPSSITASSVQARCSRRQGLMIFERLVYDLGKTNCLKNEDSEDASKHTYVPTLTNVLSDVCSFAYWTTELGYNIIS